MQAQSSTAGAQPPPAIDIRFSQIGLIQLQLRSTDPGCILEQLAERMTAAPRFFERMAVGLDLSALEQTPSPAEMNAVLDAVHREGLMPIGLISGTPGVESLAGELRLPVLGNLQGRPAPHSAAPVLQAAQPPAQEAPPVVKEAAPAVKEPPLYQLRPVRSGQRLYARNRDLVILSHVGSGAEVIADGSVHVYGTLRGRAVAGARGDRAARMFCTDFRAELVSIAGVFRLFESLPEDVEGKPVHCWLFKDELRLARIGVPPAVVSTGPLPSPPTPPKEKGP